MSRVNKNNKTYYLFTWWHYSQLENQPLFNKINFLQLYKDTSKTEINLYECQTKNESKEDKR